LGVEIAHRGLVERADAMQRRSGPAQDFETSVAEARFHHRCAPRASTSLRAKGLDAIA
jgi:hypothetical protein